MKQTLTPILILVLLFSFIIYKHFASQLSNLTPLLMGSNEKKFADEYSDVREIKKTYLRSSIRYVALNLKSLAIAGSSTLITYMILVLVNIGATGRLPQITPSFLCSSST